MPNEPRKPDFLIAGGPKCATTSLYYYLAQHPEVFMPEDRRWKEPNFFGRDQQIAPHRCIRDEGEYLRLFENARDHQCIGEATPSYLHSRTAAKEIQKFNPDMRVIVSLRNPVDLIASMHFENLVNHCEELLDLDEALAAEPDRSLGKRIPKLSDKPTYLEYSRIVQYADNLTRYFDTLGRENVLVLLFDNLRDDLHGAVQEVLKFLRVSTDISMIDFSPQNESSSKSLRNWKVRGAMRAFPNATRILRKALPHRLTHAVANSIAGAASYDRPEHSQETLDRLRLRFEPEVQKLSELIGKDLSHWKT